MTKTNKKELGKDLQGILEEKGVKVTAIDSEKIVTALFDKIEERLVNGETVNIFGFGDFIPKTRAARKGHNPSTGEAIEIAESKTVGFKPLKKLKDALKA